MPEIFAIISVILTLVAGPPYLIDILKRKTKPQRATWFILSVLGVIGFVSQAKLGINWSLAFLGLDMAASLSVFILSIPFGVGGFNILDRYALIVATVGTVLSIAENRPVIALVGIIVADLAGTALTVKKAFHDPASETTISWVLVGTAAIFGVLSVGKFEASLLLWPIYLVIANFAVPIAQAAGRVFGATKFKEL